MTDGDPVEEYEEAIKPVVGAFERASEATSTVEAAEILTQCFRRGGKVSDIIQEMEDMVDAGSFRKAKRQFPELMIYAAITFDCYPELSLQELKKDGQQLMAALEREDREDAFDALNRLNERLVG